MSDPNPAGQLVTDPEQNAPRVPRRRAGPERCRFCADENVGDVVDAGGDVGRVHRACFIEWDRKQEALEMAAMVALSLPDPASSGRNARSRARTPWRTPRSAAAGTAPPSGRGGAVPPSTGGRP